MLKLPAPPHTLVTRQLECISCREVFAIAEDHARRGSNQRTDDWRLSPGHYPDTELRYQPDRTRRPVTPETERPSHFLGWDGQPVSINCPRCGIDNRNWLHLASISALPLRRFPILIIDLLVLILILAAAVTLYLDPRTFLSELATGVLWQNLAQGEPWREFAPGELRRNLSLIIAIFLAGYLPLVLIPPQWKRLREYIYLQKIRTTHPIIDFSPPIRTGLTLFIIFVFLVPFVLFILIPWSLHVSIPLLIPEDDLNLVQRIDRISTRLPAAINDTLEEEKAPARSAIASLERLVNEQRLEGIPALPEGDPLDRSILVLDQVRQLVEESGGAEASQRVKDNIQTLETFVGREEQGWFTVGSDFLLNWIWLVGLVSLTSTITALFATGGYARHADSKLPRPIFDNIAAMMRSAIWDAENLLGTSSNVSQVQWMNVERNNKGGIEMMGLHRDLLEPVRSSSSIYDRVNAQQYTIETDVWGRVKNLRLREVRVSRPPGASFGTEFFQRVPLTPYEDFESSREAPYAPEEGRRSSHSGEGSYHHESRQSPSPPDIHTEQDVRVPPPISNLEPETDNALDRFGHDVTLSLNTRAALAQLSYRLYQYLGEGELRAICFDLDVDYEELEAVRTIDKAKELVLHLHQRGRIPVLLEILNEAHPYVNWGATMGDAAEQPSNETTPGLQRFTDVRFPEQCKIYEPVHLSIQLTLTPVQVQRDIPAWMPRPLSPSELSIQPTDKEVEERKVELTVFISAINFEVSTRWQKFGVFLDRESEKVEFELIGQKLGTQIVEVELFHSTVRVGYVVIETEVVEGNTLGQDAQEDFERVDEQIWSDTQERPEVKIFVHWQENKGLEYWITESNNGNPWTYDGGSISMESGEEAVIKFWEDLCDLLGECVQLSGLKEDQLKSVWMNIESLGQDLCNKLLPHELQQYASSWPTGSTVVIHTNEKWIPWELIYTSGEFWGNKFIMARVPKISGRLSASERRKASIESTPLHRLVHVIGGKLKPSQVLERIRTMFKQYGTNVPIEAVERATLSKVLSSLEGADLIHFTCHGHITPRPCLQLADDLSLMRCLTTSNLQKLPALTNSFIFANACSSANITSFLGELRSFAWEFYRKGAAVSIGTLGVVPTEYAVAFAERFYERLLNGYTVGESLRYAKSTAERDNPFWLLYTLYGDPFAKKHV